MKITKKFLKDCGFAYDGDTYDPFWYKNTGHFLFNYRPHDNSMVWLELDTQDMNACRVETQNSFLKLISLYGGFDGRSEDT